MFKRTVLAVAASLGFSPSVPPPPRRLTVQARSQPHHRAGELEPFRLLATRSRNFGQVDGTLDLRRRQSGRFPRDRGAAAGGPRTASCRSSTNTCAAPISSTPPSTRPSTFKSTKIEAVGEDKLKVTGDLTIHDVTKPVVLDVTINKAGVAPRAGPRSASTRARRSSAAISASAMFAPNVSDEVDAAHHHRGDGAEVDAGRGRRDKAAAESRRKEVTQRPMIIERRSDARGPGGGGWLDSRHTFSFGHYYDPQWMGFGPLRVINEDRVAPGGGLPAAPPRQHGDPQLRAERRARAQGRQRRRRRAASRRTAMDERRPRHRAQRVQRVAHRTGAFPADLDPARPAQRATGVCAAGVRSGARRGRWATCWRRPMARDGSARDPPAGVAARRGAGRGRIASRSRSTRRARYWLHVAQGASKSTAARWRRAMRWVSWTKPARCGCTAAVTASRTCCCSTCRPRSGASSAGTRTAPAGKLPARVETPAASWPIPAHPTATAPANAQTRYEVRRADLPLSCPQPSMALWNSHPRVYLAIEAEGGESQCPYCGAHFVLVD